MTLSTSIDAMFKRKRGRPPKNRVIEVRTYKFLKELLFSLCAYFSPKQSISILLCTFVQGNQKK